MQKSGFPKCIIMSVLANQLSHISVYRWSINKHFATYEIGQAIKYLQNLLEYASSSVRSSHHWAGGLDDFEDCDSLL